jgi:hypothetical protein
LPLKPTPSRHRFEKPIHNVKKLQGPWARILLKDQQISVLHHLDIGWRVASAPSVAAKLRPMARYAVPAVLVLVRFSSAKSSPKLRVGGAYRDRTDDLMLAKQPLSQLS